MTREEARKAAEVMMAYADGKEIEFKIKGKSWWKTWNKEYSLGFDFDGIDYRIKKKQEPEPTYRPFKDAKECWNEMQKHQPFGWMKYKSGGEFYCITFLFDETNFIDAYEKLTFADGTPFGIKEERK